MDMSRRELVMSAAAAGAFGALPAAAQIAVTPPAAAGFRPEGVEALIGQLHAWVDEQKLAGVVSVLARKGRVVSLDAYGRQDASKPDPVAPDSIFRIASMTKPMVGVALMQFYEQGRWKLDDPVAKHIPEFGDLKVAVDGGPPVAQDRPMVMAQLMSHSAGFGGGPRRDSGEPTAPHGPPPIDLQDEINQYASGTLGFQPGTRWVYGPSVDFQGYLVQKFSGMDLADYMQAHVFDPLKLPDTQFWVPRSKLGRLVAVHTYDAAGRIMPAPDVRPAATSKPRLQSGSGGLYSTAPDYYRFCQALLNGGQLEGARVLKPETVKLMRTNVLEPGAKGVPPLLVKGLGFGLDFAVQEDPAVSGLAQPATSFWWGGAFGTWFWIDPVNEIVFVGLIQNIGGSFPTQGTPDVRRITPRLVYEALAERKA